MTADGNRPLRVAVETGQRRCFAIAVDWPGWARSGRDEEAALAALEAYAPRYARVAAAAGIRLPDVDGDNGLVVVQHVAGDATTDFGAPSVEVDADREPLDGAPADRVIALVEQSWRALSDIADAAPASLRKGPRGGGRDRDAVVAHVVEAEIAYARKADVRLPRGSGRGPDAIAGLREGLTRAIRAGLPAGEPLRPGGWTPRYAARRIAWHVLDHAWEIEDRS